jgi:hypothetical protein
MMCITSVSVEIDMSTTEDGYFDARTVINNRTNWNAVNAIEGLRYDWQYQTFWVYNDSQGCLRF